MSFYPIGMKVMIFIKQNAELVDVGQGHLTLGCKKLWDMTDEEFDTQFLNNTSEAAV